MVLVAEDEPLVRILLGEVLAMAGFKVLEAANAAEALTILKAEIDVRVIVTDVDMPPGLNGFDLAREVARRWPAIEVLVCSGCRWPEAGDLPAGAAFLEKPVRNEVLVSHVMLAVERAAARLIKQAAAPEENVIPFRRAVGQS